ncbi:hypothetical protein, partial [Mucilaginibacter sp. 3215]|uniref:hypothetical protein n=1 Tax=Mucilaginibacter sp. 3215 TaxID=3373912 RepID=UPI003D1A857D
FRSLKHPSVWVCKGRKPFLISKTFLFFIFQSFRPASLSSSPRLRAAKVWIFFHSHKKDFNLFFPVLFYPFNVLTPLTRFLVCGLQR